jgi:hypothetical protein
MGANPIAGESSRWRWASLLIGQRLAFGILVLGARPMAQIAWVIYVSVGDVLDMSSLWSSSCPAGLASVLRYSRPSPAATTTSDKLYNGHGPRLQAAYCSLDMTSTTPRSCRPGF